MKESDRLKNILFVSYTNMFGGAESVLCDYLRNNDNNNCYIYTTNEEKVVLEYKKVLFNKKIYISSRMNIVSIRRNTFRAIKNMLYNLFFIHSIVKKNKIDILYGNNTLDVVLIVLYKKFLNKNIKVISHIHDIIDKNYIKTFIEKNNKYINQFIVPSIATKKSLITCKVNSSKIVVVYNGISVDEKDICIEFKNEIKKVYNINKDKIILCFIGQICIRKRVDLFINIVNGLNKIENKYIGLIIGKISEEKYYNQIKNQMKDSIIYLGEIKREKIFFEIYPQIDALILTSDRDPLPTVILEAMSKKVLVIARDVDGVSEIIDNRKDGIIFNYDDKLDNVVKIIKRVLELPDLQIEEIKKEALNKIKNKFNPLKKQKIINDIINKL